MRGKMTALIVIIAIFFNIIIITDGQQVFAREQVLLARFHTKYNHYNVDRSYNIELAASKINGYIIKGGVETSFNVMTGARGEKNGYRRAKIILDGKYVDGSGGGVCQVSTTLYNALLLSGMEITEVHAHTLKPDYVQPSRDAMVSFGEYDMAFKNPYNDSIVIYAKASGGDLTVDVYGSHEVIKQQFVSRIIEETPPEKAEIIYDEEGIYADKVVFKQECFVLVKEKFGAKSCLFSEREEDGKIITKKLREDYYMPLRGQIVYGTL